MKFTLSFALLVQEGVTGHAEETGSVCVAPLRFDR